MTDEREVKAGLNLVQSTGYVKSRKPQLQTYKYMAHGEVVQLSLKVKTELM